MKVSNPSKTLQFKQKKEKKKQTQRKLLKQFEICEIHGGPIAPNYIDNLDVLTCGQMISTTWMY